MYTLHIPNKKFLIDETSEIVEVKETTIQLEHSLISLKKWEQKWHKPFLKDDNKTMEEIMDYIRCMTITNNVDPNVYLIIQNNYKIIEDILEYIKDPMTATWFSDNSLVGAQRNSSEIITNEIIYYWMVTFNVPVEFQKWHLNALLTLIKVISVKNQKPRKMSPTEASAQRRILNAQRRAKFNSKG